MRHREILLRLLAWTLSGTYAYASLAKLSDPIPALVAVSIALDGLSGPVAWGIVAAVVGGEFVLAVVLPLRQYRRLALAAVAAHLTFGSLLLLRIHYAGAGVDCGCHVPFDEYLTLPTRLVRNGVLAALAIVAGIVDRRTLVLAATDSDDSGFVVPVAPARVSPRQHLHLESPRGGNGDVT